MCAKQYIFSFIALLGENIIQIIWSKIHVFSTIVWVRFWGQIIVINKTNNVTLSDISSDTCLTKYKI